MKKNKNTSKTNWDKVDRHIIQPEEYEEIPELTAEWFDKADLYHGTTLIRRGRGRPVKAEKKVTLNMRVDADVMEALRSRGKGWQTSVNKLLREWVSNPKER